MLCVIDKITSLNYLTPIRIGQNLESKLKHKFNIQRIQNPASKFNHNIQQTKQKNKRKESSRCQRTIVA